tara:strand:+ start:131 stop:364 length:234 start_codon:yes stop_codon:yes gene_type:complete
MKGAADIVALLQAAEKRAAKAREEAAQRELRARAAAADKAMAARRGGREGGRSRPEGVYRCPRRPCMVLQEGSQPWL